MFKYPKLFRLDNGSKFKSDVPMLMFEEQQKDANTHTHTHTHTHTASGESFNKELAKQLFKPMNKGCMTMKK